MNPNNKNINLTHDLTSYFVFIDDMVKQLGPVLGWQLSPSTKGKKRGRKSKLSLSELITLAIFRYTLRVYEWKRYHAILISFYKNEFPEIPNYPNFLSMINRIHPIACLILILLSKNNLPVKDFEAFIDSTSLPVCQNKRIASNRVCKGVAARSKTTKGWFYGFKLHIIVDKHRNIVSLCFSPGNTDDRELLIKLCKYYRGILVADKGYISASKREILYEKGVYLFYGTRKNMKGIMTAEQHNLLKKRQSVEIAFDVLKQRYQLEVTLPRSIRGFFAHYTYSLLTYMVDKLLRNQLSLYMITN